jgi:hypothetical protein
MGSGNESTAVGIHVALADVKAFTELGKYANI